MKKVTMFAAILLAAIIAVPASAASLLFKVTGAYSAEFLLDSDPVLTGVAPTAYFWIYGVAGTYGGTSGTANLVINTSAWGGGISIQPIAGGGITGFGPQIFSGSELDPTIMPGTYELTDFNGPVTLVISAAVPEPASWAMMIGGFGLIGFGMRRRKAAGRAFA